MHCHSVASRLTKPEVRKGLFFGECATEPEAIYELAKRRGMDFVTITDHDTIEGAMRLADRPDCFVSVELTARFAGEPREAHVLCFGIDPDDHAALQERAHDVEACAEYLRGRGILAALAFREACGGVGIGGSDDHGGIHVGLTYTEGPPAGSPHEFLANVRAGLVQPGGEQGSRLKLAQATAGIAARSLPGGMGRAAGALAARAARVAPAPEPAPVPATPEPTQLPDAVGF